MNATINNDEFYMRKALARARAAARQDEVPVGAVVVKDGVVIATGRNTRESGMDPCGHAEIHALRRAAKKLGGWNLHDCVLYVTLEPCPMCAGACVNARIKRVVFGAYDAKGGAFGSLLDLNTFALNHRPEITGGVLQNEAKTLLKGFFLEKRNKKPLTTHKQNDTI